MNYIYLYTESVNCVHMLHNGETMWTINHAKVVPPKVSFQVFNFRYRNSKLHTFLCHFKTPFAVENVLGKSFYFIKSRWF